MQLALSSLGLTQLRRRSSAAVQPDRAVTPWNRIASGFGTVSGTQLHIKSRIYFAVQGPLSELKLNFYNWRSDPSGFILNTNGFTVEEASIEVDGGSYAPVRFAGGRTRTVTAGESFVTSDAVTPSALGLGANIPDGTGFWLRLHESFTTAGHQYPQGIPYEGASGQAFPNSVGFAYDPAVNVTTGAIDGTGALSLGSGGFSAVSRPIFPVIQGKFVSGSPTVPVVVGDSIAQNVGDTLEGDKLGIGGFVQRAMMNATFNGSFRAGINMASSGTTHAMWTGSNNALAKAYWALCNGAVDNYGTNAFAAGAALATVQSDSQTLWTAMRAAGLSTILRMGLMPRTNSTDNYQTAGVNQTGVNSAFNSGGLVQQYNTWLSTQISGSAVTAVLPLNSVRDGTNTEDWVVNGVAFYATADGVHPSAAGHALAAAELRTLLASYP